MSEIGIDEVRDYLLKMQGKEIDYRTLRSELGIDPATSSYDGIRKIMERLVIQKIVKPYGKKGGNFKVIRQVSPVRVFGTERERKEPVPLIFPRDFNTGEQFEFAEDIVIRQGDAILIAGLSNFGKTTLIMNFLAENVDMNPVLMGNEYTTADDKPTPRFYNRLDAMSWVEWADSENIEKFTLLPVHDDYAEHVIKDRINLIDWINIETGEHYLIGNIINDIKKAGGDGVSIIAIQKGEGMEAGRGGQFTKDFADVELLVDRYGDNETLLTIGKVKEYKKRVTGMSWAFSIEDGVKIIDVRKVEKCYNCKGKGWIGGRECSVCHGRKYMAVGSMV